MRPKRTCATELSQASFDPNETGRLSGTGAARRQRAPALPAFAGAHKAFSGTNAELRTGPEGLSVVDTVTVTGNAILKAEPLGPVFMRRKVPQCSSMMVRLTASPSPVPERFVV
jgi:hypothetical protein